MPDPYQPIPHSLTQERILYRERNDCTVIAFAIVFKVTYAEAHKHMKERCGRMNRKGVISKTVLPPSLPDVRFRVRSFNKESGNATTLGRFIKDHPVGRYYVCVRGHALAVVDGVVYDYYYGPKRQVKWAMRVHLEEKDNAKHS